MYGFFVYFISVWALEKFTLGAIVGCSKMQENNFTIVAVLSDVVNCK